jgi:hypothetical protein
MQSSLKDTVSAALSGALIGYLAHGHWAAIEWLLHHLVA